MEQSRDYKHTAMTETNMTPTDRLEVTPAAESKLTNRCWQPLLLLALTKGELGTYTHFDSKVEAS